MESGFSIWHDGDLYWDHWNEARMLARMLALTQHIGAPEISQSFICSPCKQSSRMSQNGPFVIHVLPHEVSLKSIQ